MTIEFDGVKIIDTSQAKAMFAQGFISNVELERALKELNSKGDLKTMSDLKEENLPSTFIGRIVKKVRTKLNL